MKNRFLELDILRAVAVLLVVLVHSVGVVGNLVELVFPPIIWLKNGGWIGVDIFFVLSGFLVGGLLFREYQNTGQVNAIRFLARRGFKIYPSFYLLVIIGCFVPIGIEITSPVQVFRELFFLQNFSYGIFFHTWSLAVEEHFYLMLSLAILELSKLKKSNPFYFFPKAAVIIGVSCLSIRLLFAYLFHPYNFFYHYAPTYIRIDALFAGALIAYFYYFHKEKYLDFARRYKRSLVLAGIILLFPCSLFSLDYSWLIYTFGYTLNYLGASCLLIAATVIKIKLSWFTNSLGFIGKQSYSIYLWHVPILDFLIPKIQNLFNISSNNILFVIYFVLSLGIGAALGLLIEKPFLALRDRLIPAK